MRKLTIIVAIIMALSVAGFVVAFVCTGLDFSVFPEVIYANADNDFSEVTKTVDDLTDISCIEVSAKSERVILENNDGDTVEIKYFESDYKKTELLVEGGKIILKTKREWKQSLFRLEFQSKKTDYMLVSIPKTFSGRIDLTNTSDAIKVTASNSFSEIRLKNSSGNITVEGLNCLGTASIQNSSSDIKIKNSIFGAAATIKNSSGHTEINKSIFAAAATVTSSSSSIKIKDTTFTELTVKNKSGGIKLESVDADSILAGNSSSSINFEGVEADDIRATNSSGSINLNVIGQKSDYNMDLKTRSGRVRLDGQRVSDHYTQNIGAPKALYAHTSSASVNINFS